MKTNFIPEIPYEHLVKEICGSQWRSLPPLEISAAWGVAIVASVLDGVKPELDEISSHLGISSRLLFPAFSNLKAQGIFKDEKIFADKKELESEDLLTWGYYGGYASGATHYRRS